MPTINASVSSADIARVASLLRGIAGGADTAMYRSINKALSTVNTQAAKGVGAYLPLKAARIKKDFTVTKARKATLAGKFVASGIPVGLINFAARMVRKGVSVKVLRKGSRKTVKHAYIAKGKNATEHVWWREYSGPRSGTGTKHAGYFGGLPSGHYMKGPVERLTGPRIEDALARDDILGPVQTAGADQLTKTMDHEVERMLQLYG